MAEAVCDVPSGRYRRGSRLGAGGAGEGAPVVDDRRRHDRRHGHGINRRIAVIELESVAEDWRLIRTADTGPSM